MHHRSIEFQSILENTRSKLQYIIGAEIGYSTIGFTSTGTGAMESVSCSVVPRGRCLFLSNGYFGDRFFQIASNYSTDLKFYRIDHRDLFCPEELDEAISKFKPDWVFCIHHETRCSLLNQLAVISQVAKKHGARIAVDCTSTIVCEEIQSDKLDLDLVFYSSAKGLRSLPGLALVTGKNQVFEDLPPSPYGTYFDLKSEYQSQILDNRVRFAQAPQLYIALHSATDRLMKEGVAERRRRISQQTNLVRNWAREHKLEPVIPYEYSSSSCTTFYSPLPFPKLFAEMKKKGFLIFYGETNRNDQFQISTMGELLDADVHSMLECLQKILKNY